ncbi:hypothetical protein BLNAU_14828 [Blattamonas nauphoetae]|uniref:Uncharacterized protein n=1 Tax=Blattamonas nauphoetae TaxID=2049346 RepID=A0ABQ9XHB3_9EUKA|nr:hypothetical protein BLNAU_14828 [Blattamonas nauphoetae]
MMNSDTQIIDSLRKCTPWSLNASSVLTQCISTLQNAQDLAMSSSSLLELNIINVLKMHLMWKQKPDLQVQAIHLLKLICTSSSQNAKAVLKHDSFSEILNKTQFNINQEVSTAIDELMNDVFILLIPTVPTLDEIRSAVEELATLDRLNDFSRLPHLPHIISTLISTILSSPPPQFPSLFDTLFYLVKTFPKMKPLVQDTPNFLSHLQSSLQSLQAGATVSKKGRRDLYHFDESTVYWASACQLLIICERSIDGAFSVQSLLLQMLLSDDRALIHTVGHVLSTAFSDNKAITLFLSQTIKFRSQRAEPAKEVVWAILLEEIEVAKPNLVAARKALDKRCTDPSFSDPNEETQRTTALAAIKTIEICQTLFSYSADNITPYVDGVLFCLEQIRLCQRYISPKLVDSDREWLESTMATLFNSFLPTVKKICSYVTDQKTQEACLNSIRRGKDGENGFVGFLVRLLDEVPVDGKEMILRSLFSSSQHELKFQQHATQKVYKSMLKSVDLVSQRNQGSSLIEMFFCFMATSAKSCPSGLDGGIIPSIFELMKRFESMTPISNHKVQMDCVTLYRALVSMENPHLEEFQNTVEKEYGPEAWTAVKEAVVQYEEELKKRQKKDDKEENSEEM